jgi:hypothetical protein
LRAAAAVAVGVVLGYKRVVLGVEIGDDADQQFLVSRRKADPRKLRVLAVLLNVGGTLAYRKRSHA